MSQFYPNAICDMAMNHANESGGLVTPPEENFNTDAMRGSMQQILADNLGLYTVCEFLVGTQAMTRKEGILYSVGRSYMALYDETSQNFVVCDIFSLKFVTFYMPGHRPGQTTASTSVPVVSVPGMGQAPSGQYGMGASGAAPAGAMRSTGSRTMGGVRG